ncbi:spermatogenesis-associated protein 17 isoform X2 [Monodelphis domestica]|uniref:Spermatosis associated 17 n=1 Tax=Monodelphis domestica TaxID=13616 RepID=A0A5F8GJ36_MONDO|nr:spermatogenesis-associated protein 17 isoform X2 [Monodelphis domestica]
MATLVSLQSRLPLIDCQYYYRNRTVDGYRKKEYKAAVKIQSWFRGCRVRAYIRYLNKMMTVIQKWWRGYLGRKHYRQMVKTAYLTMKMNFYNEMAVRIQKRWRGFKIRKYCFNYYYLKEYLRAISDTNQAIREALEEFAEMRGREKKKADLEKEEKRKQNQARKTHYLLSTKQIPGIYNSPFRDPDPMEFEIRKVRAFQMPSAAHQIQQTDYEDLSTWLACTSKRSFPRSDILPPINRKQCQGPFRDIAEVLQQRYKPLQPTLRVATSINSEKDAREELRREEWNNRVHDNVFLPFSSFSKNEKYVPMVQTSTKYNGISYAQKQFQEEEPTKWMSNKDTSSLPSGHFHCLFLIPTSWPPLLLSNFR